MLKSPQEGHVHTYIYIYIMTRSNPIGGVFLSAPLWLIGREAAREPSICLLVERATHVKPKLSEILPTQNMIDLVPYSVSLI